MHEGRADCVTRSLQAGGLGGARNPISSLLIICVATLVLALVATTVDNTASAAATSITVISTADTVEEDGQCSLREAIINAESDEAANPDCAAGSGEDEIVIEADEPIRLQEPLPPIDSTMSITSPDGAVISGDSDGDGTPDTAIVTITGEGIVSLQNLTLRHGVARTGGAVDLEDGVLRADGVRFEGNRARVETGGASGAAITTSGGTLSLSNAGFVDNVAFGTGGAIATWNTRLEVTDSTFRSNQADFGAAILGQGGTMRIETSTFTQNYSLGATVELTNVTGEFVNVTFDDNSSEASGALQVGTGSAANARASAHLNHVTIVRTVAPENVGNEEAVGLRLSTFQNTSVQIDVTNSLIESCAGTSRGTETIVGSRNRSLAGGGCDREAFVEVPEFLLGPLSDNGGPTLTAAPRAGSPAIGQGDPATCAETDQRGVARPQGVRCDLGAVEVTGDLADSAVTPSPTPSPTPFRATPTPPDAPEPPDTGGGAAYAPGEPVIPALFGVVLAVALAALGAFGVVVGIRRRG